MTCNYSADVRETDGIKVLDHQGKFPWVSVLGRTDYNTIAIRCDTPEAARMMAAAFMLLADRLDAPAVEASA